MKKNTNKIIAFVMVITIVFTTFSAYYINTQTHNAAAYTVKSDIKKLSKDIDFNEYDSLMIVAHPDDETIWGGDHLKKGKYLVVCITNGDNKVRRKEFNKVMKASDSKGIILSFPDKTDGKRDNWKSCKEKIAEDIKYIIEKKDWKQVVTHNPDGEYGHKHHIMTNRLVTTAAKQAGLSDELLYFGKYIKAKQMQDYIGKEEMKNPLSKIELAEKETLTSIYSSQKKVMQKLGHMFPYENWISYHTWYNY